MTWAWVYRIHRHALAVTPGQPRRAAEEESRFATGCLDAARSGQNKGRRINLQRSVLTATRGGRYRRLAECHRAPSRPAGRSAEAKLVVLLAGWLPSPCYAVAVWSAVSRLHRDFSQVHRWTRVSNALAASHKSARTILSPHLLMPPLRSVSPDAYLRGVSPKWAPTTEDLAKRAGSSKGQGCHWADTGHAHRRRHTSSARTAASTMRCSSSSRRGSSRRTARIAPTT